MLVSPFGRYFRGPPSALILVSQINIRAAAVGLELLDRTTFAVRQEQTLGARHFIARPSAGRDRKTRCKRSIGRARRPLRNTDLAEERRLVPPWKLPATTWVTIVRRAWREQGDDNIGLAAAGVSFYGFLALVPMLGALVLTYGMVASPDIVVRNVRNLAEVMPVGAAKLVGEQLMAAVTASTGKKGTGLALALAIALFGARNAAAGIMTALNISYEEPETRGFVRRTLLAIAITLGSVFLAITATVAAAAIGHLNDLAYVPAGAATLAAKCLTQILLGLVGAAVAATLYRVAPAHRDAGWQWLTPGSLFSAIGWVLLTLAFKAYAANFGRFDATYGSLSAVVVLLTWLYLSSYVFLFGAELNSELEKLSEEQAGKR